MSGQAVTELLHLLSVILMTICLAISFFSFRQSMNTFSIRLSAYSNMLFGIFSIPVTATGLARAYLFDEGAGFFLGQPLFQLKIGLFVLIGLVAAYPATVFYRIKKEQRVSLPANTYRLTKFLLLLNFAILLTILWVVYVKADRFQNVLLNHSCQGVDKL